MKNETRAGSCFFSFFCSLSLRLRILYIDPLLLKFIYQPEEYLMKLGGKGSKEERKWEEDPPDERQDSDVLPPT